MMDLSFTKEELLKLNKELNKISLDLENKLKQFESLNKETMMCLEKMQSKSEIEEKSNVVISPAVAEMENPYVDLMQ